MKQCKNLRDGALREWKDVFRTLGITGYDNELNIVLTDLLVAKQLA